MASQNESVSFTEPLYSSAAWIGLQLTACFFIIFQTYILLCLLLYERHRKKVDSNPVDEKPTEHFTKKKKKLKSTIWLDRIAIMACMNALLKCSTEEIDLFLGTKYPTACDAYTYLTIIGYGACLSNVLLFVWLRQAAVQSHPKLKSLAGTRIRILASRVLLVLLVFTFIILFALNFVTVKTEPSPQGCVFADKGTVSQSVRSSSGLVFTVFFQPVLASLLLDPLLKKMPKTGKNCKAMPVESKIRRVLKRTLITLGVITITDIITIIASYKLQFKPCIYLSSVYDANCLIGVLSLVFAQANWKEKLLFKRHNKVENDHGTEVKTESC